MTSASTALCSSSSASSASSFAIQSIQLANKWDTMNLPQLIEEMGKLEKMLSDASVSSVESVQTQPLSTSQKRFSQIKEEYEICNKRLGELVARVEEVLHRCDSDYQMGKGSILKRANRIMKMTNDAEEIVQLLGNLSKEDSLGIGTQLLIDTNSVNRKFFEGQTFLMRAAISGQSSVVQRLIDARADLEIRDNGGMTALFYALGEDNDDIVERLIEGHANLEVQIFGNTALNAALYLCVNFSSDISLGKQKSRLHIVHLLVDGGANLNAEFHVPNSPDEIISPGNSSLLGAAVVDIGDSTLLKKCIDRGFDFNLPSMAMKTPLRHAAEIGNDVIMKVLIDAGVDIFARSDVMGRTTLMRLNEILGEEIPKEIEDGMSTLTLPFLRLTGRSLRERMEKCRRLLVHESSWREATIVLAFSRANRNHPFRESIVSLVPDVMEFLGKENVKKKTSIFLDPFELFSELRKTYDLC